MPTPNGSESSSTSDGVVLTVRIVDDGIGFDADATKDRGLGLAGMRERALILRADLSLESGAGQGLDGRHARPASDRPAHSSVGCQMVGRTRSPSVRR